MNRHAEELAGDSVSASEHLIVGDHLSPLALDSWLEFNRWKWNVQPLPAYYALGNELPAAKAVLYLNRQGRVVLPRLNPYLPVSLELTRTEKRYRVYRQRLQASMLMATDMRARGLGGVVNLAPVVTDTRPWRWAGFSVGTLYTFYVALPVALEEVDPAIRRRIRKAQQEGYRCEQTANMAHALAVLAETEERQGFSYHLRLQDLQQARTFLGDEHFRAYVGYAPGGAPASVVIVLHRRGGSAIYWVAGSGREHLQTGAPQLVLQHILEDLHAAGARGLDLAGANIPAIAEAKMRWGGRLVPYPAVESYGLRSLARWALRWLQSRHARQAV